jgi:hypothetical protein
MTDAEFQWTIDPEDAALDEAANAIGFRAIPPRSGIMALSIVRSGFKNGAYEAASIANAEKTREQLDLMSISETAQAVEFFSYCSGYLGARMFHSAVGDGPVLSRLLFRDDQAVDDAARKDSLERAKIYLPALSEIHDNRAAPRDSRMVHRMLSGYLAVLIEDPRQTTLDTMLRGYEEPDTKRGISGFSARQIADMLDQSRLWATLGWRRGLAERRFRAVPQSRYLENIAGDARVMLDADGGHAWFADLRRVRKFSLADGRQPPHPCDDATITEWVAQNCELARVASVA